MALRPAGFISLTALAIVAATTSTSSFMPPGFCFRRAFATTTRACNVPSLSSSGFHNTLTTHHRALFLTPENQHAIDEARRRQFRASSTTLHASTSSPSSQPSSLTFSTKDEYFAHLSSIADLPLGFKVGTSWISFTPQEANFPSRMNVTLIALDEPTDKFALALTKNAFPGAPVRVGKQRKEQPLLQAIVVNNKISNVCPGGYGGDGGVADAELVCAAVAKHLNLPSGSLVLPSSTGVIGWRLPFQAVIDAVPSVLKTMQSTSILPAAAGIITTDRYPKIRAASIGGGKIVGIAKGAGMIEPNLATMLVYLLTDLAVPREVLRQWLPEVVGGSFNCISVDSDQSTSDTVVLLSSGKVPVDEADYPAIKESLISLARKLAEDIVRNGEGTNHVIELKVSHAPSLAIARALGRQVINSPLLKCAIAGNDPNVGRLAAAVGSYVGNQGLESDLRLEKCRLLMGGKIVFKGGAFELDPEKERYLVEHMEAAQLEPGPLTMASGAHIEFPPHERNVMLEVDLGEEGGEELTLFGSDLTYAYVTENADYRS
ncbi:arginine biosynthesis bifunctional protein [Nannochloropsis oceanica]